MSADEQRLGQALEFISKVTASATHEIKNELAVINEQSRLVQEMLAMAARREPDPARLEELMGRVVARVDRADQAVRRLNAFAHSAEDDRRSVDAAQALALTVRLFQRTASQLGAAVEAGEDLPPVEAPVRPIWLEMALWAALEAACRAAGQGGGVRVDAAKDSGELVIGLRGQMAQPPEAPPAQVLEPAGATAIVLDQGGLELRVRL